MESWSCLKGTLFRIQRHWSAGRIENLIRPAVVGGDPTYKGDDMSFCNDYGSNSYAPDMHEDPPEPE